MQAGDLCGYPHIGSHAIPHFWDDCGLFRFFPHRFVLPPTVSRPVHSPHDFPIVLLNPHAQAGNGMVSLTQELGTVISCGELEGGLRGTILLCVCFPCQCWESIFSHLRCVSSCLFSLSIVVCVYVFPLSKIENWTSLLFWDCVMLPSFSS